MKVLLFGASGSGTTTLGKEIERRTEFIHLDVDDYYWKNTDPPYQEKVPLEIRNNNLKADFRKFENVIVSGSLVSWGKEWISSFDLAIFLHLNKQERMARLKKREAERYGNKLLTDPETQKNSRAFLEWASQYDNPDFNGRSYKVHNEWMKLLTCKTLRVKGEMDLTEKTEIILTEIKTTNHTE